MKITSMKAFLFAAMFFSFTKVLSQNLVLNPSFEDHINCPLSNSLISGCKNWFFPDTVFGSNPGNIAGNPGNVQPTYFNDCTPLPDLRVPNIWYGYQYPRTGKSMIGFQNDFYSYFVGTYDNKYYPEDSLATPLLKDKKYHIGCYINPGNLSNVFTNDFGIYISDSLVSSNRLYMRTLDDHVYAFTKIVPQIANPKSRIIEDTAGWVLVDGIYTAHGGEKFITLGCFETNADVKAKQVNNNQGYDNFLYVDDVFVIPVIDSSVRITEYDTFLCSNQPIVLHTNKSGSNHLIWQDGSTKDSFKVNKSGTYWVHFDSASFSNTDTIHIRYDSIINTIPNTLQACAFPDTLYTYSSAYNYSWPDSSTGNRFVIKKPGVYSYSITSGHCKADASITVQSGQFPPIVLLHDTVVCTGHPIKISIPDFSGSIRWQDGNTNNNYIITKAGNYSVSLSNQCGTKTYTSTIVDSNCDCYIYVPDAFSPNKDQHNDMFIQASNCITEKYSLQIYNRWGEMIFQSNDINQGWNGANENGGNGIYKSSHCPPGVYIYKIIYKFQHSVEQEKMGTVEVM